MERNLDRRIEAVVPIEAPDLQKRLQALLDLALMDDANTWTLQADGAWAQGAAGNRCQPPGSPPAGRHDPGSGENGGRGL